MILFSSWSLAGVPRKVLWLWQSYWPHHGREGNFFYINSSSLSAKRKTWKQLILSQNWYQEILLWTNANIREVTMAAESPLWVCSNSTFSCLSADSYQSVPVQVRAWVMGCVFVCLQCTVRESQSATPGSQCQAEAAVLAQLRLCCQPAGRAARRACCTAGTLSSPPTT